MFYPIFEALKAGERFPVSTLIYEMESVNLYWDWWWSQAPSDKLTRPHTVSDDDPWLTPTKDKPTVDTETFCEFLSEFSHRAQELKVLRRGAAIPRAAYRGDLIEHVLFKSVALDKPVVVLTGGGYGAGKTSVLDILIRSKKLPLDLGSQTGVDFFKPYLPEFSFLQRLAEGRASSIVQEEARLLAYQTFDQLIENRRSFGWDSSMSNPAEILPRIAKAKEAGYELILVAVFSSLELAIAQAMHRAKLTRRFAHPEKLPESHVGFCTHFSGYLPHFDKVLAFENELIDGVRNTYFIAEQVAPNTGLAIHDEARFRRHVSVSTKK